MQSAVNTQQCPIAELQRSYAAGETDDEGPNFLLSLVQTDGLESKDVIGLVTDLFASGIDSVRETNWKFIEAERVFPPDPPRCSRQTILPAKRFLGCVIPGHTTRQNIS